MKVELKATALDRSANLTNTKKLKILIGGDNYGIVKIVLGIDYSTFVVMSIRQRI